MKRCIVRKDITLISIILFISFSLLFVTGNISITGHIIAEPDTLLEPITGVENEVIDELNTKKEANVIIILEDSDSLDYLDIKQKDKEIDYLIKIAIDGKPNYDLEIKHNLKNTVSGKLTKQGMQKLAEDPAIKEIYLERPYSTFLDIARVNTQATQIHNLRYSGSNLTGEGQTICVIDTGVDFNHPELADNLLGGYDFVNNDNDPQDDNGHGSHIAGAITSQNGIAPDADIVAIKALDYEGNGYSSDIIAGIYWCTDNATKFNINTITMSLGTYSVYYNHCDELDPPMSDAINYATSNGLSVIISAGNSGSTTGISSPSCMENAIPAGAVNDAESLSYNRNNLLKLVAPGVNINSLKSTTASCLPGCSCTGDYMECSGTSMATPQIAASFALLKQYNSLYTTEEIEEFLYDNGNKISEGLNTYSSLRLYDTITALDNEPFSVTITTSNQVNQNYVNLEIISNRAINELVLTLDSVNYSMQKIDDTNWWLNFTCLVNNNYEFSISATDLFGNNKIVNKQIIVNKSYNNLPTIVNISNHTTLTETDNFTYYVTATDSDCEQDLSYSWYLDEDLVSNETTYEYIFNSTNTGLHNVTVIIFDGFDTLIRQLELTILGPIIVQPNQAPVFESIQNIETMSMQQINITGSFNASDPDNDDLSFEYSQFFDEQGLYTFGNNETGNHTITINASDEQNTTSTNLFILVTTCTELWTCTTWGSCIGDEKVRICTDSNHCETISNKPSETQSCTSAEPGDDSSGESSTSSSGGGGGGESSSNSEETNEINSEVIETIELKNVNNEIQTNNEEQIMSDNEPETSNLITGEISRDLLYFSKMPVMSLTIMFTLVLCSGYFLKYYKKKRQ